MKKARLLVVEDEGLVALSIEKYLTGIGYEVLPIVGSGEEAIKRVPETEPDLVIMDIRLHGDMDGVEAAKTIKDNFHIPVIYLTSYSDDATLERAKMTEPYGYIRKPFDGEVLKVTVEMALHTSMMQTRLRRAKEELQTILESLDEGVILADMSGNVDYLNPAALKILSEGDTANLRGVSLARIFRVFDPKTLGEVRLPLTRAIIEGEHVSMSELLLVTADERRLPVDFTLVPFRDEGEITRGVLLTFKDVSERLRIRGLVTGEQERAIELRATLLPSDGASLADVEMRCAFHPATLVAGDFFDFVQLDAKRVAVYIADVIGHGVSAAAVSILLHRLLTPEEGTDGNLPILDVDGRQPARVVERLNRMFYGPTQNLFFSLLYGVIDNESRSFRFVRAGHPHPVLQKTDGSIRQLVAEGNAVGITDSAKLSEEVVPLDAGDRLYLYSDGLVECANPQMEQFSAQRFLSLIERSRGRSLKEAVATIDRAVAEWIGKQSFDDDVALVGLEVK